MKKMLHIVLLLLGLLCLCGCAREKTDTKNTYQIYYVSNSETKVEKHACQLQAQETAAKLEELLDYLSVMPEKLEYKAPLAMGFGVLSMKFESGRVLLDVDAGYYKLPATTEVLARAAIVKTLTQLKEVSYVGITVEGNQLFDAAGELVGWMNADQFINNDGNEINTYELVRVKLYFANETGDKLISAYREKHYSTNISLERFVVEQLIAGPSGQIAGLYPTINPQTKVINVMTKDGICYVNLDTGFLTALSNVSTETAVYSIVNSLVELSNINKVQILVNGEVPSGFGVSTFERNLDNVILLEK